MSKVKDALIAALNEIDKMHLDVGYHALVNWLRNRGFDITEARARDEGVELVDLRREVFEELVAEAKAKALGNPYPAPGEFRFAPGGGSLASVALPASYIGATFRDVVGGSFVGFGSATGCVVAFDGQNKRVRVIVRVRYTSESHPIQDQKFEDWTILQTKYAIEHSS